MTKRSINHCSAKSLCASMLLAVTFVFSGCTLPPKVADDLLAKVTHNQQPLVSESASITVQINPEINNYEKIDASVRTSIELALKNTNIFGANAAHPYRIDANILGASQSRVSFGSFEGTLQIRYSVFDPSNNKVLDQTISTIAGSDEHYLSGAARHRRSRAVNISKNVLEFVDILQTKLKK